MWYVIILALTLCYADDFGIIEEVEIEMESSPFLKLPLASEGEEEETLLFFEGQDPCVPIRYHCGEGDGGDRAAKCREKVLKIFWPLWSNVSHTIRDNIPLDSSLYYGCVNKYRGAAGLEENSLNQLFEKYHAQRRDGEETSAKKTWKDYVTVYGGIPYQEKRHHLLVCLFYMPSSRYVVSEALLGFWNMPTMKKNILTSAIDRGLWLSKYQRPTFLYEADLKAQPKWDSTDFLPNTQSLIAHKDIVYRELIQNIEKMKAEGETPWDETSYFKNLVDPSPWKRKEKREDNNEKEAKKGYFSGILIRHFRIASLPDKSHLYPKTVTLVKSYFNATDLADLGFFVVTPGTHVIPFTSSNNLSLSIYIVLRNVGGKVRWRQAESEFTISEDGSVFIVDESFEHEIWHEGTEPFHVLKIGVVNREKI